MIDLHIKRNAKMFEIQIYDNITYKLIIVLLFTLIFQFTHYIQTIFVSAVLFILITCTIIEAKIQISYNFNRHRLYRNLVKIADYLHTEEFNTIIKTAMILFPYFLSAIYIKWLEHKVRQSENINNSVLNNF